MSDTIETEGRGLDYERYALGQLFARLVRERSVSSVLEIPAGGEKAMPSIYSLAFGAAGCQVTLVNPQARSLGAWRELDFSPATWQCDDPVRTGQSDASHDLVWNFVSLGQQSDPAALVAEMTRLSRRWVLFVGVNRHNPGFVSHRLVHRLFQIPWTHGRLDFMSPEGVERVFELAGLEVVETGLVDSPPYPDSIGFRDLRLHRKGANLSGLAWRSRTVEWMRTGSYPARIRLLYLFERLPLPQAIRRRAAHLFFVLGAVTPAGSG